MRRMLEKAVPVGRRNASLRLYTLLFMRILRQLGKCGGPIDRAGHDSVEHDEDIRLE